MSPGSSSTSPQETTPAGIAGLDLRSAQLRWPGEARHSLKTPGSYEWWYFNAISPAGDGVLITLFEGLPFHPHYLSLINRHAHRLAASPYDKVRPELSAAHYPAAYMALYQAGKKVAQFLNIYPPDSAFGQADVPEIRIGPNRITFRQDGSIGLLARGYPFETHGRPKRRTDQTLTAQLTFTPTFPSIPHTRPFRAPSPDGATHHWILAAPHARATGSAQLLDNNDNLAQIDLRMDCLAYHDHVYGHGGLSTGVDKILWGFLQGPNWAAAWHQSILPHAANDHASGLVFFEQGRSPVIVETPTSQFDQGQLTGWLMRHPRRISMHGSDAQGHPVEFIVSHNAVLESAPFHTRLTAAGSITIPGRGSFAGTGATHMLKLRRLKWPILSDLTLMAITLVRKDDPMWRQ